MKKSDIFMYYNETNSLPETDADTFVAVLPEGISNISGLFEALLKVLMLPGYFGSNWNALSDCLRDFHWIAEKKIILIHEELPQLPSDDLLEYIDILYECINNWEKGEEHELRVMFPESSRDRIIKMLN